MTDPAGASLLVPEGTRLLHIGPPKTGTTALQAAFWAARATAERQGVHYAGQTRHSVSAVLAVTGRASFEEDKATPPIAHWERLLEEIRASRAPRVVLSSEGFSFGSEASMRRVLDDLDPSRTHVVMTLRPLPKLFASEWQEHAQSGMRAPFDAWLDNIVNSPEQRVSAGFWHRHRHDRLVERWAGAVGADRVTVVVVDERDHDRLYRVFEELVGLRAGTLVPAEGVSNRSLTLQEIEAVRALRERFAAEGLSGPRFHRVVRMHVTAHMKTRVPGPDEPRIETPQWALDRAGEIAAEIVAGIAASGVRVVGDLASLAAVPRSRLEGDRLPEVSVPPAIAASMAMGVVVASGLDRDRAGGWIEPLAIARLSTREVARLLARRARRSVLDRVAGHGRGGG